MIVDTMDMFEQYSTIDQYNHNDTLITIHFDYISCHFSVQITHLLSTDIFSGSTDIFCGSTGIFSGIILILIQLLDSFFVRKRDLWFPYGHFQINLGLTF